MFDEYSQPEKIKAKNLSVILDAGFTILVVTRECTIMLESYNGLYTVKASKHVKHMKIKKVCILKDEDKKS